MPTRFFLKFGSNPEREVSREEYVHAERAAGFHNSMNQPDAPATASFGAGMVSGRSEYYTAVTTVVPHDPYMDGPETDDDRRDSVRPSDSEIRENIDRILARARALDEEPTVFSRHPEDDETVSRLLTEIEGKLRTVVQERDHVINRNIDLAESLDDRDETIENLRLELRKAQRAVNLLSEAHRAHEAEAVADALDAQDYSELMADDGWTLDQVIINVRRNAVSDRLDIVEQRLTERVEELTGTQTADGRWKRLLFEELARGLDDES